MLSCLDLILHSLTIRSATVQFLLSFCEHSTLTFFDLIGNLKHLDIDECCYTALSLNTVNISYIIYSKVNLRETEITEASLVTTIPTQNIMSELLIAKLYP